MSDTLLRQWAMLNQIPPHPRKIDAHTLRDRLVDEGFDINVRSVQRDLDSLSRQFPLVCDDREKPFGWSWDKAFLQSFPGMDPPTALTFTLAQQFLEPLLPRSSLKFLTPYFRQADKVLKNLTKQGLGRWPRKVRIVPRGQTLLPAEVLPDVVTVVYEALLEERRFSVQYHPREERQFRDYEVNPLGLVFRGPAIYLVCTLWNYDDIKQLALHRMKRAKILETPRKVPKGFDLDQYIEEGGFAYPVEHDYIELKARFEEGAAAHLCETPLSEDQRMIDKGDGWVLVEATVQDTAELRWWLLGFGDGVEVLEPKRLRREFAQIAESMSGNYFHR